MPRYKKESCLTILKEDGKIDRYAAVVCKCSCGNIIRCKKTLVKSGRKKSCGCIQKEAEYVSKYIMRMYWTAFLLNAKSRNIKVKINPEYLDQLLIKQNFKCQLSGLEISLPKTSDEFLIERLWTASIDRIDSSKEYTKNNIQFVHKDINKMKMALDQDQFIKYCKCIADLN